MKFPKIFLFSKKSSRAPRGGLIPFAPVLWKGSVIFLFILAAVLLAFDGYVFVSVRLLDQSLIVPEGQEIEELPTVNDDYVKKTRSFIAERETTFQTSGTSTAPIRNLFGTK